MHTTPVHLSGINVRNLKNITVDFLTGEIVALTGLSGSGKSSLAFNTIYAAGIQCYTSTLPSFLAHMFALLPTPNIKKISGLSPTIAVRQNYVSPHMHTTVGMTTEIYQHLALLFSLDGHIYDPTTHSILQIHSKEKILDTLYSLPEHTPITILSPIHNPSLTTLQECIRKGYTKIRMHGAIHPIYPLLSQPIDTETPTAIVVDSLIKNTHNRTRLHTSLSSALELGNGECLIATPTEETLFSIPKTQEALPKLTPASFSPHTLHGRCTHCQGSGIRLTISNPALLINENASIKEHCCTLAGKYTTHLYRSLYQSLANTLHFSLDTPWKELPDAIKTAFLYGQDSLILPVPLLHPHSGKSTLTHRVWRGILNEIGEKIRYSSQHIPEGTQANTCSSCLGTGIKEHACTAIWQGKHFHALQTMPADALLSFLSSSRVPPHVADIVEGILDRLSLLIDLGLPYLTLDRAVATLSGGEQTRVALVKHLGAKLSGITYILDEPSLGLHPQDTDMLIHVLQRLRAQGNTILLVEHDERMILSADRILDIGPKAGRFGGEVVFNGSIQKFLQHSHSLTAQYLRKERTPPQCPIRPTPNQWLTLSHATTHHLKNITVSIPLERITAITGVSGSGKSSLINDTLVPALQNRLQGNPSPSLTLTDEKIKHLLHVTPDLPHLSSRSIPLTYIQAFDDLRELFAKQKKSQRIGLTKRHFSFNTPLGSCTECRGLGSMTLAEDLTPIPCPLCQGKRFQPQILRIQYEGKNIADILEMTAHEAKDFFLSAPHIHNKIQAMCSLGLDHLPLGRPLSTLSGGEIQRLKLAKEILKKKTEKTIYILDEPTIGLHPHDVHTLIQALLTLSQRGHTIILIEHNTDMIRIADYILELGPQGGAGGGHVLAACPLSDFLSLDTPTAKALSQRTPLPLPSQAIEAPRNITITNAHQNNLKHLDLTIPKYALTAINGPSASGKGSLIDTLYAFGNITYSEIFPSSMRHSLIQHTPEPKVNTIHGLSPVVSIKKSRAHSDPRHTFASALNSTHKLAKLFALLGTPHSPVTGEPLIKITPNTITDKLMESFLNQYVTITVPFPPEEDVQELLQKRKEEGYLKIFANHTVYDVEGPLPEELSEPALVILHSKITHSHTPSILSSLTLAFSLSDQIRLYIHHEGSLTHTLSYTRGWVCSTGTCYPNLTYKHLSRDYVEGQCQQCSGSGTLYKISLAQHLRTLSAYTPIALFKLFFPDHPLHPILTLLKTLSIAKDTTISSLTPTQQSHLFHGKEGKGGLEKIFTDNYNLLPSSPLLRPLLSPYSCSACQGSGMHAYGRSVSIHNISLPTLYQQDAAFLKTFLKSIQDDSATTLLQDLGNDLARIEQVGLQYIAMGQPQNTLSTGERYRLHIAKHIARGLSNLTYVLENPLSGAHPQDLPILITLFKEMTANKNTLIATDRSQQLSPYADHTLTLGPGSGPEGGYLSSQLPTPPPIPSSSSPSPAQHTLSVLLSYHNLHDLHVQAPLHRLVSITGVSGSGKTLLLTEGFYKHAQEIHSPYFSQVVFIDDTPLPNSSRSDIGTYLHITQHLREFYASLTQSKALNLSPSVFSPNTKIGQCPHCLGLGSLRIDRDFYPPERIPCPTCHGLRLQNITQHVLYEGIHFGELLHLPIQEVANRFLFLKKIHPPLQALMQMGLGYLSLGRSLSSLSTSEKMALHITKALGLPQKSSTLFLLDGVTSSLDEKQKHHLHALFRSLLHQGHSILHVDNDLTSLKQADYIIELGPKAGKDGGRVIFSGTPKEISSSPTSLLKEYL